MMIKKQAIGILLIAAPLIIIPYIILGQEGEHTTGFSYDDSFIIMAPNQKMSDEALKILNDGRKKIHKILGIEKKLPATEPIPMDFHISFLDEESNIITPTGSTWSKWSHPDRTRHLVWIQLPLPPGCTPADKRCVLIHELTHGILDSLKIGGTSLSVFEQEGVATLIEKLLTPDEISQMNRIRKGTMDTLLRKDKIPPIVPLLNKEMGPQDYNTYAVAQSFFTFLFEEGSRGDEDGGKKLWWFIQCREELKFQQCIKEIYNIAPTSIDEKYKQWLIDSKKSAEKDLKKKVGDRKKLRKSIPCRGRSADPRCINEKRAPTFINRGYQQWPVDSERSAEEGF